MVNSVESLPKYMQDYSEDQSFLVKEITDLQNDTEAKRERLKALKGKLDEMIIWKSKQAQASVDTLSEEVPSNESATMARTETNLKEATLREE